MLSASITVLLPINRCKQNHQNYIHHQDPDRRHDPDMIRCAAHYLGCQNATHVRMPPMAEIAVSTDMPKVDPWISGPASAMQVG